jgi:lipid II:glycine glycyltransferase (peptidoglycan interpeptide bridge formation enzyme)
MRTGTKDKWDEIIASLPGTHIMQSWNWGEVKRFSGWEPIHKIWWDEDEKIFAAALILTRVISLKGMMTPLRIMYLPRGPLVHDWKDQALVSQVFADLHKLGRKHRVIFIKIDPEVELGR